jgi:hypothetical protein
MVLRLYYKWSANIKLNIINNIESFIMDPEIFTQTDRTFNEKANKTKYILSWISKF